MTTRGNHVELDFEFSTGAEYEFSNGEVYEISEYEEYEQDGWKLVFDWDYYDVKLAFSDED